MQNDNALRVFASEAPELYYMSELLARYVNNHVHFDLCDLPEKERLAAITQFKDWIEELLA